MRMQHAQLLVVLRHVQMVAHLVHPRGSHRSALGGDRSALGGATGQRREEGSDGSVEGGAGEFYPPGLEKTFIEMYSNDLCRSLKFNFTKAGVYTKGISSYEFRADEYFFANATMNPANKCFDSADLPSGVFDVSACRFGAPVFISLPHFYLADPFFLDKIESGLTPNETLHSTIFRVEPRSGIPLDVSARFQLNVKIEKIPGLSILDHVTETYFPVMWFENKAGVPDNLVFKMKLMANLHEILEGIGWVQIGLALAIGIISLILSAGIIGFMIFNFPFGWIFLGDTGAYLIGFVLAWLGITLVETTGGAVSPWALILLFFWPLADVLFAVLRRLLSGRDMFAPDRLHLHSIVNRGLKLLVRRYPSIERWRNPLTTLILLPLFLVPPLMGISFFFSSDVICK